MYFYLFIFIYLFNDALSSSDYVALDDKMIVNNISERMWKETVVA
jgi:hypothetical protein